MGLSHTSREQRERNQPPRTTKKDTMAEEGQDVLLDYEDDETEVQTEEVEQKKDQGYVDVHSSGFRDFLLKPELMRAIVDCGFEHPSPVQHEAIPQAILGDDVICQAKSGTGKTAVFVIATLQQMDTEPAAGVHTLVMCHTRELAFQILSEYKRFSKYLPATRAAFFCGGVPIVKDREVLNSEDKSPHIVIGTPGRLFALACNENTLKLNNCKHFVLDECDHMLDNVDMRAKVQKIFMKTPREGRQVMMLSATFSPASRLISQKFTHNALEIFIDNEEKLRLEGLQQYYCQREENQKNGKLLELLDNLQFNQVIIFVKSTARCRALTAFLVEQNFPTIEIHGGISQPERIKKFTEFKEFKHRILVATDVLARGIDIERVNIVFNYDLPELRGERSKNATEDEIKKHGTDLYLHRVARAGRFGTKGLSITFVATREDADVLQAVQERYEYEIKQLNEGDTIEQSSYMNV